MRRRISIAFQSRGICLSVVPSGENAARHQVCFHSPHGEVCICFGICYRKQAAVFSRTIIKFAMASLYGSHPSSRSNYLSRPNEISTLSCLDLLNPGIPTYSLPVDMNLNARVVLYDGVSRVSNAGVKWLIQTDKKKSLSFCPVQSKAAIPYLPLCGLRQEDALNRFIFVEGPIGQFSEASTAALRVAMHLPVPYRMMRIILILVLPECLRDLFFGYIARRRYKWFGKANSYILPNQDAVDRFINSDEILAKYRRKSEL
ncbi:hypothetical protein KP509_18G079700 [Ceratopteris richardii]|uniref:DUF393 domain-containing protein n=1 Tax=Ceratopteris richardii TaxID=49495 RepID=A0A8T2SR59_CERRI|nr:hypothetical protein KP509_18G079700 [Ceratopteris richardii]